MLLNHQLVVLPSHADAAAASSCALARARITSGLAVRDAAALMSTGDQLAVVELAEVWPERRALGRTWWKALASAIENSCQYGSRSLVEAEVSRSFLAEVGEALAAGQPAVALVAERVEIGSLLRDVGGPPFLRVIYGSFPESAIDDLCEPEPGE